MKAELETPAASRGYEQSDAHPSTLLLWLCALAGVVAVVVWLAGLLFAGLERSAQRRDGSGQVRAADDPPPAPRLQADPAGELAQHRALEERRTREYAWVDRSAGIVRVPVERAMELLLERGLPVAEERRR